VIAAGGMTDFGRAAHNIVATGVAILAARAHEGMAAAASAGPSALNPANCLNLEKISQNILWPNKYVREALSNQ
jgi:hypothetical protein